MAGPGDFDLIWTLLEHKVSVELLPVALYNYREHEGERLSLLPYDEKLASLQKILRKHGISEAEEEWIVIAKRGWLEL